MHYLPCQMEGGHTVNSRVHASAGFALATQAAQANARHGHTIAARPLVAGCWLASRQAKRYLTRSRSPRARHTTHSAPHGTRSAAQRPTALRPLTRSGCPTRANVPQTRRILLLGLEERFKRLSSKGRGKRTARRKRARPKRHSTAVSVMRDSDFNGALCSPSKIHNPHALPFGCGHASALQ